MKKPEASTLDGGFGTKKKVNKLSFEGTAENFKEYLAKNMPQLVPEMTKTGSPSSPISMSEQFTSIQLT